MDTKELKDLKAGDYVLYERGSAKSIRKIDKITPTGRIKAEGDYYCPDGRLYGNSSKWYFPRIRPLTEEDIAKMKLERIKAILKNEMTNNIFIGIDPGKKGAIAVINNLNCLSLIDCPLINNKINNKKDINIKEIKEKLEEFEPITTNTKWFAVIEKAQAMPGQGVTSMFNYGKGYGIYLGILTTLGIPFCEIRPQVWKKEFNLIKQDKAASVAKARELYPQMASKLLKTKDGRAEALLIAEYAKLYYKKERTK